MDKSSFQKDSLSDIRRMTFNKMTYYQRRMLLDLNLSFAFIKNWSSLGGYVKPSLGFNLVSQHSGLIYEVKAQEIEIADDLKSNVGTSAFLCLGLRYTVKENQQIFAESRFIKYFNSFYKLDNNLEKFQLLGIQVGYKISLLVFNH